MIPNNTFSFNDSTRGVLGKFSARYSLKKHREFAERICAYLLKHGVLPFEWNERYELLQSLTSPHYMRKHYEVVTRMAAEAHEFLKNSQDSQIFPDEPAPVDKPTENPAQQGLELHPRTDEARAVYAREDLKNPEKPFLKSPREKDKQHKAERREIWDLLVMLCGGKLKAFNDPKLGGRFKVMKARIRAYCQQNGVALRAYLARVADTLRGRFGGSLAALVEAWPVVEREIEAGLGAMEAPRAGWQVAGRGKDAEGRADAVKRGETCGSAAHDWAKTAAVLASLDSVKPGGPRERVNWRAMIAARASA